jgi:Cof subfamily protein (haloacid dehalogenase superfamily)
MPRLLVLDIDGTLLNSEEIVTPVVKSAIAEARALGVSVALATGRRVGSTREVVDEVGIQLPIVTFNGALVWDTASETAIHELAFSPAVMSRVVELSYEKGLAPVLLQGPAYGERIFVPERNGLQPEYLEWFLDSRRSQVTEVAYEEISALPGILTIDIFGPEMVLKELSLAITELEAQVYDAGMVSTQTDPPNWALNVHMPGASKAAGVQVLAQTLGCTLADVVAIGDGYNDLPLLEAAGTGVAMGNAADEVKRRADAVVNGHDEDGVAEAIERFVLEPLRAGTSGR